MLGLVIAIIIFALLFDFLNGANDRANAIATVTATKSLSPLNALILASIFNLAGAFLSTKVAETIGKGIIGPQDTTLLLLLAGVLSATIWSFICTKVGIPISVTHALIGGLVGAGIVSGGLGIINWDILGNKVLLAIVLGPAMGFLAGALLFAGILWLLSLFFRKVPSNKAEKIFGKLQIFSASFMALTHGMNDSQNAMGIITASLLAGGFINGFFVPWWVKICCGLAMGLGTFFMGWKVMETLGWKLTKLEAKHGFAAETGASVVIGLQSIFGMPVSTTHVIGSSIIGGTLLQNFRRIKQIVAVRMFVAWIITIPSAGLIGALSYWLISSIII